jgi:hypothetical protein
MRNGSKIVTTEAILCEWLNALADASSRGIGEALTTDHHFEQAGLKALMLSVPGA